MAIEIRVPALGESVAEATVGQWFKQAGEAVTADEPLVELETDKVTIEVPAPISGVLSEIMVKTGDTVVIGALLGAIAEGAGKQAAPAAPMPPPAQAGAEPSTTPPPTAVPPAATVPPATVAPTVASHTMLRMNCLIKGITPEAKRQVINKSEVALNAAKSNEEYQGTCGRISIQRTTPDSRPPSPKSGKMTTRYAVCNPEIIVIFLPPVFF